MSDRVYGRPGYVDLIPGSEPDDFPDDPVVQDANAEEATERAIREGTARRRPAPCNQ